MARGERCWHLQRGRAPLSTDYSLLWYRKGGDGLLHFLVVWQALPSRLLVRAVRGRSLAIALRSNLTGILNDKVAQESGA